MLLSRIKEDYQWYSAKASDVSRQLALAGFAVIWVFNVKREPGTSWIAAELLLPAFLLGLSLAFDLLQYLSGALIWGFYFRYHTEWHPQAQSDPDLQPRRVLRWPGNLCFYAKEGTLLLGWYGLLDYLWRLATG